MTTAPTPPALAIADLLEYLDDGGLKFDGQPLPDAAAAELIRLQAEIECLRAELEARKPLPWEPGFDFMAPGQEELAMQFCLEIAGPRGKKGSPPDPVRLMEMCQALYKAEADAQLVDKSPNLQEPLVDKTANLQDRPASLIASREVVADSPVRVTRLHLTEEGRAGLTSKATGPLPGITGGSS